MENIKKLREQTGAGIVDCKKALEESEGDIENAVEILRKKGISKASKRSNKEANEGTIKVDVNQEGNEGYIMQINSETDFVAKNEEFQKMADEIMKAIKENKPQNIDELLNLSLEEGTVREKVDNISGVIKEKIVLNRYELLQVPTVGCYSHMNGTIGVLVGLDVPGKNELAKDLAMHIAAANPQYIKPEDVPAEILEKEKDIHREQLKQENKPEEIMERIIEGKINKYYEENCLLKQEFIKDEEKKIEDLLGEAKINKFIRYSL
jgi:elongation factor Ts